MVKSRHFFQQQLKQLPFGLSMPHPLLLTGCAGATCGIAAANSTSFPSVGRISYDPLSLKPLTYFGRDTSVVDHPILSIAHSPFCSYIHVSFKVLPPW